MANTGRKVVTRLKEVTVTSQTPTGNTKPNTLGDPDYIAPSDDLTACPLTYATTCPVVSATGQTMQAAYEFSLSDAVLKNPSIKKVRVKIMDGAATIYNTQDYVLPHPNYFSGIIPCDPGDYYVGVDYLDINDAVLASCNNLTGVSVASDMLPG